MYAVGHRPVLPVDRAHGALLAAGPRAALSHRSAASLCGLVKDWQFPFEVTTVEDRRVTGITIHRSSTLRPRDLTVQLGVRTTTMARTIFDLAPSLSDRQLERMIDTALHTPYLSVEQLHELISRLPHTAAARRLRTPPRARLPADPLRARAGPPALVHRIRHTDRADQLPAPRGRGRRLLPGVQADRRARQPTPPGRVTLLWV